jgi:hypothetical protein
MTVGLDVTKRIHVHRSEEIASNDHDERIAKVQASCMCLACSEAKRIEPSRVMSLCEMCEKCGQCIVIFVLAYGAIAVYFLPFLIFPLPSDKVETS